MGETDEVAKFVPAVYEKPSDHQACGMWKDREDHERPRRLAFGT